MIKVLSVIGTRPEAIKMAPVIGELKKYSDQIISCVCVTAQHRQLLDQVLNIFSIAPDYDLDVMQENQTLSQITGEVMSKLEPVLLREKPDWVLVQGDTTTVMTTALLAYYHRIRIAHVEAGLRTHDKFHPFPEEINRKVADVVADLHFAHTEKAKENLLSEGVNEAKIYVTGNTVIDALLYTVKRPCRLDGHLAGIPWDKRIILVTAHRRENFGKPLVAICHALLEIVDSHPEAHIIYPVHPNPNVQEPVRSLLGMNGRISLLEPLDYLTFVHLMQRSYLILTDSGGLQEEAPSLGRPVLVLRQTTERVEAVQAGAAIVVGTAKESITSHVHRLLEDNQLYERMASVLNPYGDGRASERIVRTLLEQ